MREAALEIARIGDPYQSSAVERMLRRLRAAVGRALRSLRRSPASTPIDPHDPRLLADLGLRPGDLPDADTAARAEERWRRV
jgi:hypothetical protein